MKFRLGFEEGELWVMSRGLNGCLEEVLSWLEGLVPRENLVLRAVILVGLGWAPQHGCGAPRPLASGRGGPILFEGVPRRRWGGPRPLRPF